MSRKPSSRRPVCMRRGSSADQTGLRNKHVMTFSSMEMLPPSDVSDRHADIFEVGRTAAADAQSKSKLKQVIISTLAHDGRFFHLLQR